MVSIRIDRRAFYVLLGLLGLGIPLGIGYLLATMMPGANAPATTTTTTNPAAQAPAVPPSSDQSQAAPQQDSALASIPRISIDEAKALHGKPDAVFYDVRTVDQYNSSHIEGALSVPEVDVLNQIDKLPKDKDIVLYCT